MKWGLVIVSRAKREIRRLPAGDLARINRSLIEMVEDPFAGDVKFLRGTSALRRRIGEWRLVYELLEAKKLIVVIAVRRRRTSTY